MANRNQPHLPHVIEFIQSLPASVISTKPRVFGTGFACTMDCGPRSSVSDASPMCGGPTIEAACQSVKDWLLDDLQCLGILSKRHYQPHWDQYDLLYRLGDHWKQKLAEQQAQAVPA